MNKEQIRKLFSEHGVPLNQDDVWMVQGKTPVIKHAALERLAAHLGLTWDMPREVMVSMTDVVIMARATRKDGIAEWSYGEVSVVRQGVAGGNYKVTGNQPGYPWAMAEKRAKDRVIIKLAGLHGAYSEEEADDFNSRNADRDDTPAERPAAAKREQAPPRQEEQAPAPANDAAPETRQPADVSAAVGEVETAIRSLIDACTTINQVTDLMLSDDIKAQLESLGREREEVTKAYGKERLFALGWKGKRRAAAS